MKIKRILLIISLSLIFELVFLYYINDFFLTDSSVINSKKIFVSNYGLKGKVESNIPKNAKEIKTSFDGNYISYLLNNKLIIINTKNLQLYKELYFSGYTINYYVWLPDRNRVVFFKEKEFNNRKNISLYSYDVDNTLSNTVNKDIYLPSKSVITDITLSPLTNMIYVKASNNSYDQLYQINIMGELRKVNLPVNKIIKMYEMQKKDNLIYQSANNIIHVIEDGKRDIILSDKKFYLIGIDNSDRVYIGKINKNKNIYEIYYGYIDSPLKKWDTMFLKKERSPRDIVLIPKNNDIGILDKYGNIIIQNKQYIKGYGNLIYINKSYIVYENKDKIIVSSY